MLIYILLASQLITQVKPGWTGFTFAVPPMPSFSLFNPPPIAEIGKTFKSAAYKMGLWTFNGQSEPEPPKPAASKFSAMKFNFVPPGTPPTKPEVKPPTKPETKPEIKPETKPGVKPEVKSETKPPVKPETKPAVKPETKPPVKPETKPAVNPETKTEVKPETKPEIKPEVKPEVKPEPMPETQLQLRPVIANNVLPADAPGAAILGDRLKGLYVPLEMLQEIGKQLVANEIEDQKLPGNGVFKWSRTAVQVAECEDPNVNIKAINKILREIVGLENIDAPDKPWSPEDEKLLDLCKNLHDEHRTKHYAHALYNDERINYMARFYATELAAVISCCGWNGFYHSQYGLGENVFVKQSQWTGYSGEDILREAIDRWYKEGENFQQYGQLTAIHNLTQPTGHFTTMIWRDSQYFGLGLSKATKDNVTTYVCVVLYDPPGNFQKLFPTNVLEPGKYEGKARPQIKNRQERFVEGAFLRLLRDVEEKKKYSNPWEPEDEEVISLCKNLHNKLRTKYYAHPLYNDERLNNMAQFHATELAAAISCCGWKSFFHSNFGLSENVHVMQSEFPGHTEEDILRKAMKQWYKEGENFEGYGKSTVIKNATKPTGHFTAMIWRDSQYFGLGLSKATKDDVTTYVCVVLYDPPGNLQNQFSTNVLEPGKYEGKTPPQIENRQDRFVEGALVKLMKAVEEKKKYVSASTGGFPNSN